MMQVQQAKPLSSAKQRTDPSSAQQSRRSGRLFAYCRCTGWLCRSRPASCQLGHTPKTTCRALPVFAGSTLQGKLGHTQWAQ